MATQEGPRLSARSSGMTPGVFPAQGGNPALARRQAWTLQSVYRRAPWIGVPMDFLDRITTARQWAGLAGRGSGSPFVRPDSTRLGRALRKIADPIGEATARLRARSAAFRRTDWAIRQFIWSLLWSMTIAYRFRPRPVRVPRKEKPITMVRPSTRHADFKAEMLSFRIPCPWRRPASAVICG